MTERLDRRLMVGLRSEFGLLKTETRSVKGIDRVPVKIAKSHPGVA